MQGQASIYDLLAKKPLSQITITDINAAMSKTKTDTASFDFWQGVIMLQAALTAGRTYGHGLPIPETSAVYSASIDDGAQGSLKPDSPEVWQIAAIDKGATNAFLFDGSNSCAVPLDANGKLTIPLTITPTLYLIFDNGSGGSVTVNAAYHKVSL
jgi:hypothetical protein